MLLVFGGMFMLRGAMNLPAAFTPFMVSAAVTVTFFVMVQLLYNLFGPDRNGFRALVLSPVPRHHILVGKNLAMLPIAIVMGELVVTLVVLVTRISPFYLLVGLLQLISLFLIVSMAGNLFSILLPFRMSQGSLKPTKIPKLVILMMMGTHMLFPLMALPIFLGPLIGYITSHLNWAPALPVNLLSSGAVMLLSYLGYRLSLPALGRLFQRREIKILATVTHELE